MIDFEELNARLGNFMSISDGNLSRLMLQRKAGASGKASGAGAAAAASSSSSSSSSASASASSPAHGLDGTTKPSTPRGFSDTDTVATAALDLSPTAQKMRKVLGRQGMTAVLGDAKKISAKAGSPASAAVVPASQLRDTMAKHGVPLTAKEVRALSIKYHGTTGPAATRSAEGVVDVEAMLRDTFISNGPPSGGAGASPASKGRAAASPRK
jgi:hypothetical protein